MMEDTSAKAASLWDQRYGTPEFLFGTAPNDPGVLENLYTEEILCAELGTLDIVELRHYEAALNEGTQHAGRSALIGLVGREAL